MVIVTLDPASIKPNADNSFVAQFRIFTPSQEGYTAELSLTYSDVASLIADIKQQSVDYINSLGYETIAIEEVVLFGSPAPDLVQINQSITNLTQVNAAALPANQVSG